MKRRFKNQKGQTIVEYIIVIVIVVVAGIVVLGAFSGRVKNMLGTATQVFGGEAKDYKDDDGKKALDKVKAGGNGDVDGLTAEN